MAARKAKKVEEAPITPLKLPRGVKTLVVYGGSFDPPHEYHLQAWVLGRIMFGGGARTLYVPAARNPLKERGPVASDEDRVAMLLAGGPWKKRNSVDFLAGVWTDEIDRARWHREQGQDDTPSFTIDTIRRLRTVVPESVTLRLLIGSDQALSFHKWKSWRTLLREAEPIVAMREPAPTPKDLVEKLDPRVWSLRERLAWAGRIVPYQPMRRSSTDIRALIARQPLTLSKWRDEAKLAVPHEFAPYIIKHRLYGVGTKHTPAKPRIKVRSRRG
jgi:nicotinate-nucleotide adenylyltransferase